MHLWADAYERDLSSILDLQRSLATDIARRINAFVKPLDGRASSTRRRTGCT
jgi:TolB-like protein